MKIKEMFTYYGLGEISESPIPVSGGLMHKMYKVSVGAKIYAVKVLNPMVMKREGVLKHIRDSEQIGIFFKNMLPVVPAIPIEGEPILQFKNEYFILFNWIEGKSIFPPNIRQAECSIVGEILGRIHNANIKVEDMDKHIDSPITYDWNKYLNLGLKTNQVWVEELKDTIVKLQEWNKKIIVANKVLSKELVISHRDLDPKNIMWHNSKPFLIDWEAAGYVNPYQELLELLSYWADTGQGGLDKDLFSAFYSAYKSHCNCSHVDWDNVIASGYSGLLGWLNYSFSRSLGLEATSVEEMKLGTDQVFETIEAIQQFDNNVKTIKDWLIN